MDCSNVTFLSLEIHNASYSGKGYAKFCNSFFNSVLRKYASGVYSHTILKAGYAQRF